MFIVLVWISYKHVSANSSHCSESWNKVVPSWVSQMSCWCFSSSNRFVSSGLFVPPCLSTPTLNCVFSKFWPLGFNPHLVLEPSSCNRNWLCLQLASASCYSTWIPRWNRRTGTTGLFALRGARTWKRFWKLAQFCWSAAGARTSCGPFTSFGPFAATQCFCSSSSGGPISPPKPGHTWPPRRCHWSCRRCCALAGGINISGSDLVWHPSSFSGTGS